VEKFKWWTDPTGVPESAVDRDHMLTNVTLYWLAATAGSSARLYKESARTWTDAAPSRVPRALPSSRTTSPRRCELSFAVGGEGGRAAVGIAAPVVVAGVVGVLTDRFRMRFGGVSSR
jgi:hypothetical protein